MSRREAPLYRRGKYWLDWDRKADGALRTPFLTIFWYDPALYPAIYQVLRSQIFGMSAREAKEMMRSCFTEESVGLHLAFQTHTEAVESYKVYLDPVDYACKSNREMSIMAANSIPKYLATQRKACFYG